MLIGARAIPIIFEESLSASQIIVSGIADTLVVNLLILVHVFGVFMSNDVLLELQCDRVGTICVHFPTVHIPLGLLDLRHSRGS